MVRGPSDSTAPAPMVVQQDCTDTMGWPIVDGVMSGLFFASMFGALAAGDDSSDTMSSYGDDRDNSDVIASGVVMGSIAAASAYVGYSRVQRCRTAKAESATQMQNQMGYGAQPYGAYPGQYPAAYPQAQPQYAPMPQPYPPQQYPPQPYPPAQPQPYPQAQPQQAPQPPPLVPAQPR